MYQDNKSAIILEVNGKKSAGNRIRGLTICYYLWKIKLKEKIYRYNIFQQMKCGEISWQSQRKEKSLGTLETMYLVEMDRVELVYEGPDR